MPAPKYRVELLDSALVPITRIINMPQIDTTGNFLEYSKKLSTWGEAKFRVATKDPLFANFPNILQPWANHVRITRDNYVVFQGVITDNPTRTKNYVEVKACSYLFFLTKVLLRHDPADGAGAENYRNFTSGTMGTAIQTILTEAKADVSANSIIANLQIGTIENPNFPKGFQRNVNGVITDIAGQPWNFFTDMPLKFDYRDINYVINAFATYSLADYELVHNYTPDTINTAGTNGLTFNFKKFLGTRRPEIIFEYGPYGAVEDYNAPLRGSKQANYLVGIAADDKYQIIKIEQSDADSIKTYGKLADVAAYIDVKNTNALGVRLTDELRLSSTPDAEIQVTLNAKAFPLGLYDVGDIVTIRIKDHFINVNQQRRIVAYDVKVHESGKETIRLVTNIPRADAP